MFGRLYPLIVLAAGSIILFIVLIVMIYKGEEALKRAREKRSSYKIEGGHNMAKSFKKITISIPIELDKVVSALVEESKRTTKPISKSELFVVATYEYLHNANEQLKAKPLKEE